MNTVTYSYPLYICRKNKLEKQTAKEGNRLKQESLTLENDDDISSKLLKDNAILLKNEEAGDSDTKHNVSTIQNNRSFACVVNQLMFQTHPIQPHT